MYNNFHFQIKLQRIRAIHFSNRTLSRKLPNPTAEKHSIESTRNHFSGEDSTLWLCWYTIIDQFPGNNNTSSCYLLHILKYLPQANANKLQYYSVLSIQLRRPLNLNNRIWNREWPSICSEMAQDRRAWSAAVRDAVDALEAGQLRPR